jgi:hypothetical protein
MPPTNNHAPVAPRRAPVGHARRLSARVSRRSRTAHRSRGVETPRPSARRRPTRSTGIAAATTAPAASESWPRRRQVASNLHSRPGSPATVPTLPVTGPTRWLAAAGSGGTNRPCQSIQPAPRPAGRPPATPRRRTGGRRRRASTPSGSGCTARGLPIPLANSDGSGLTHRMWNLATGGPFPPRRSDGHDRRTAKLHHATNDLNEEAAPVDGVAVVLADCFTASAAPPRSRPAGCG